jgi:hypothetical protein
MSQPLPFLVIFSAVVHFSRLTIQETVFHDPDRDYRRSWFFGFNGSAWKAGLTTNLVNDDVAFEIRRRVESTIVMRLEIFVPPFAKT